jgi:uncharacterized protein (DUF1330 family)
VLEEFVQGIPNGQPIVLINLLRYRDRAALEEEELTGRACYERYAKALEPILMSVGGRPIWRGQVRFVLIGPPNERWDEIILVAYPRRTDFERLLAAPEYLASAPLRTAALEDSRLIAATAPQSVSRLAWSLYKLASRARRSR